MKSGYLIKLDTSTQTSWKKRWVVLTRSTISYFESYDIKLKKTRGSLPIYHDSCAKPTSNANPAIKHCFVCSTLLQDLHLSARSDETRDAWLAAINSVAARTPALPRSLLTRRAGMLQGGNKQKFFVLHNSMLTYHSSPQHVKTIQGSISLRGATFKADENSLSLVIATGKKEE